jgi:hypothetical protein
MPENPEKTLSHPDLLRCLSWDPDTGQFTWLIAPSRRIKAGDPAGSIIPDGRYIVTLHGRRYYGHRLAWFYAEGEWPAKDTEPRFRDGDRANCSIHNLTFVHAALSDEPRAVTARNARRKQRARAQQRDTMRQSPIEGILRSPLTNDWVVYHPEDLKLVIGRERSFEKALFLFFERRAGVEFINAHPIPKPEPEDLEIYAGPKGSICLAEAHAWLAYDPKTGAFYHRTRHQHPRYISRAAKGEGVKGLRADELNTNGTPVIGFFSRDYSAASMAIFMRERFWPARRSVRFKDGNKANTVWANLIFDTPEKDAVP